MNSPFVSMDLVTAKRECSVRIFNEKKQEIFHNDICPNCGMKVLLHCESCKIQITGCVCTEVARKGKDDAYASILHKYGPDKGAEYLRNAGYWVPEGYI